jgi:hypothetical protein
MLGVAGSAVVLAIHWHLTATPHELDDDELGESGGEILPCKRAAV